MSELFGVCLRVRNYPRVASGDVRKNWQWVAARVCEAGGGRKTPSQCKMRWERILNPGVKKGLWTKEEDQKLKEIAAAMEYKWSHVSKRVRLSAELFVLWVSLVGSLLGGKMLDRVPCTVPSMYGAY